MLSTGCHATYANPGPYYLQTTLYGQAFLNTRSRDKLLCFQVSKADVILNITAKERKMSPNTKW